jgi:OOP family OmpA-OmpF porin
MLSVCNNAALAVSDCHHFYRGAIYVGSDVGTSEIETLSGRSSSYGAFVGYQLNPAIAVEAGYRRLARSTEANFVDVRAKQRSVSLIATAPLNDGLSVFGRLGFNKIKSQVTSGATMVQENRGQFLYGVGMGYDFTKEISGRVEFQKPSNNVNNVSVGVSVKF